MNFGKALGTACATFAVTNIDDIFVLVTFFAESSTSTSLTPARITIGQYVGFTVIIIISLLGFGASYLFPTEPIGFLGLLPILLGIWWLLGILFRDGEDRDGEDTAEDPNGVNTAASTGESATPMKMCSVSALKSIFKVATITIINGADNISTYIPLFSQAKGAEIAIYVITYYILLGVWCLAAFLIMKQRHILRIAQKYARIVVPFLYLGLGIFIIVESECYPWSIERIDDRFLADPGTAVMAAVTVGTLLPFIGAMIWLRYHKKRVQSSPGVELASSSDPQALEPPTLPSSVR